MAKKNTDSEDFVAIRVNGKLVTTKEEYEKAKQILVKSSSMRKKIQRATRKNEQRRTEST